MDTSNGCQALGNSACRSAGGLCFWTLTADGSEALGGEGYTGGCQTRGVFCCLSAIDDDVRHVISLGWIVGCFWQRAVFTGLGRHINGPGRSVPIPPIIPAPGLATRL